MGMTLQTSEKAAKENCYYRPNNEYSFSQISDGHYANVSPILDGFVKYRIVFTSFIIPVRQHGRLFVKCHNG